MPFTKSAVELFISARAAAITKCGATDMKTLIPESEHWLSNFGLAVIFNDFPPAEIRPFVIEFIRRIYASFIEYELARQEMLRLVKDGYGRWSPYFAALTHLEVVVSQLYLAMNSIRKRSNHDFFTPGDGSFEENLNLVYNSSKHQMPDKELPVWFTDEAICCDKGALRFDEIEDYMSKMAGVVKGLCNREIAIQALKS